MKKSTTKRALLMSVLSMFLCFTMLIGTTFAWFTDEVESGMNTIVAGNLDVELYNGDKQITGEDTDPAFFDDVAAGKWEPGAMAWETFTVKNVGNLALKYKLTFKVEEPTEGVSLAKALQIAVVDGAPLANVTGRIDPADYEWQAFEEFTLTGELDLTSDAEKEDVRTFIVWWEPSDNDNDYNMNNGNQGKKASVAFYLDLFATQLEAEMDSFGDDYDAGAPWTGEANLDWYDPDATEYVLDSADELAGLAALVNGTAASSYSMRSTAVVDSFEGKTIILGSDINLNNIEWTPIGSAAADHGFMGNFDGNGYTIKNLSITDVALDADDYAYAGFFGVTEGAAGAENVIKNLKIENVTIKTAGHIVAAAVAYPYYTTLENITVCGDIAITGGDYTSGALAYTRRCTTASNITVSGNAGSYITGRDTVGGVISDIQMNGGLTANYSNFSVSGVTVTGDKKVGGISGIICNQTLNGATVKDVVLVSSDARVGIVSGCFDTNPNINNVTYENVTGTTAIAGAPYKAGVANIVYIDGVEYVGSVDTVKAYLEAGKTTINFACDINGDFTVSQKPDVEIVINGDGHNLNGVILVDGKSATYTTAGLTIKNIVFAADSISADACIQLGNGDTVTRYTCNVTVENCTFDVPGAVGVKSYTGGDKNLTITGCTATANAHSLVQAKGIDGILVEKCVVNSKNGLNFNNSTNVVVDDCEVDVKGYAVRFGESKGGSGDAEVYTIKNSTLKSANDEGDATIILRGTADYSTLTIVNTTIVGTPDIANTATGATVVK